MRIGEPALRDMVGVAIAGLCLGIAGCRQPAPGNVAEARDAVGTPIENNANAIIAKEATVPSPGQDVSGKWLRSVLEAIFCRGYCKEPKKT